MESIIIVLIAFTIITMYDIVGSILSRILNFEYVWLAFGSFIIYGIATLYINIYSNIFIAIVGAFFIGVFDSTVGLIIADKLRAKISEKDKQEIKITPTLVFSMGALTAIIGLLSILMFS